MSCRCARIAAFGAALFVLAGSAAGQNTQNTVINFLDAIPAKDGGVVYSVTPGSDLVLPFTVDKGGKLELYLSPLRGEHGDTVSTQSSIDKSSEFGVLSIFRFNEMAALGIATLFAVITGLATYYFGKAGFGSITDYVSLFVWGARVDQTKNFLQQLGKTSGTG